MITHPSHRERLNGSDLVPSIYLSWITPGVGSAISGAMTALGAITAVLIAHHYFGGKVRNVTNSLDEIQNKISGFQSVIDERFSQITSNIDDLNAALGGVQDTAARTQAAVYESREYDDSQGIEEGQAQGNKQAVALIWNEVANLIEKIASSENIDGRTRAKYGRIDRRSYYNLISSLNDDGRLLEQMEAFKRAAQIWYSCRRATDVSDEIKMEIQVLKDQLIAAFSR
jgi:hypothetical protein